MPRRERTSGYPQAAAGPGGVVDSFPPTSLQDTETTERPEVISAPPSQYRYAGGLPADTTSFLGRRQEIADIKRRLTTARIVTLTGTGGVGKTRLALRVASQVRRAFHDRVWLVELAELHRPDLLASAVADALGIQDRSARPTVDTLVAHLAAKPALLVLDNCEHLIEHCAALVEKLLRSCPELRVLATSRQSLDMLGENTVPVAPFAVPDPDRITSPGSIAQYDSVRLFVERATGVVPEFTVNTNNYQALARVCYDLDGIPLALELTAARLRSLSLRQIAQRLTERYQLLTSSVRDLPARQQTLRSLIDWSYSLCAPQEQRVWARVSVFSGGFDLDAAEFVASDEDIMSSEILDVIDSLVGKSVLMQEHHEDKVRYRMLQTTREYASDKLIDAGEQSTILRRHRDWYLQMAERFADEFIGPDQITWITRLRREHANLRVALDYCASTQCEASKGLRLAALIEDFWTIRGLHSEVRHWLDHILPAETAASPERASGLRLNGWFAMLQGDAEGEKLINEAGSVAKEVGDQAEIAYVGHAVGGASFMLGNVEYGITEVENSLAIFRETQVLRGRLYCLLSLGIFYGITGEREKAIALLDECIATASTKGDLFWNSYAYWAVSYVEVLYGNLERAEAAGKQSLELLKPLNDRAVAVTLDTLAWVAEAQEKHRRAAILFGVADTVFNEMGTSPEFYAPMAATHTKYLKSTQSALSGNSYETAFKHGRELGTDNGIEFALETQKEDQKESAETYQGYDVLTKREFEIARLVASGLTNKEIAASLIISQRTAEGHVEHILTKLGYNSRTQIASWVTEQEKTNEQEKE